MAPPGAIECIVSPGAVEAHPRTLKAYTGAINATPWSFGAHPGALEALPRAVEAYPCALEVHPWSVDGLPCSSGGYPRALEVHPKPIAVTHFRATLIVHMEQGESQCSSESST